MQITAFYKFVPITEENLQTKQEALLSFGKEHGMRGLVLLATEGINGTVCAESKVIAQWKELLNEHFGEIIFKDSESEGHAFPRFFVKIREEIVTLKDPDIAPEGTRHHLTPEEWHAMLEEDVVVLDTRNDYETEIGMFEDAVDPKLKSFQEFPEYVEQCAIPKDKKVMMYCTGGIRCEKALLEMEKLGYKHVYQLEGGILAYLKKYPNAKFKGECFVFDHRVSVDQDLKPSERYRLCPLCGDPGDQEITCEKCGQQGILCALCTEKYSFVSCSKNCKNHLLGLNGAKIG